MKKLKKILFVLISLCLIQGCNHLGNAQVPGSLISPLDERPHFTGRTWDESYFYNYKERNWGDMCQAKYNNLRTAVGGK